MFNRVRRGWVKSNPEDLDLCINASASIKWTRPHLFTGKTFDILSLLYHVICIRKAGSRGRCPT